MIKKYLGVLLIVLLMICFPVNGAFGATLYDDGELVVSDTAVYPKTDEGLTCGKSGNEFSDGHFTAITMGGVQKTSWGSVVSPITDASGYVNPTDAGAYVRIYDAGYLRLGDATNTGDYYVLFQSDSDAWQIGNDDGTDDFIVCHGGTMGSDNRLAIDDSADVTKITIGDAAEFDMQITFDGNAQDYSIGLDDTADDFIICLGSALGTTTALSIDENLAVGTFGDVTMGGTTPVLTIGDAGEEDAAIVFDGNAQDFHIGLDDTADDLVIGVGSALGTTPAISITDALAVTMYANVAITGTTPALTVGDGGTEDNMVYFDGVTDFAIGVDHTASIFEICNGANLDATCAISIDANEDVTLPSGSLYIIDDEFLIFGAGSDVTMQYDEAVDDQFIIQLTDVGAAATTDPLFEILVPATPTADQDVFGVAKGDTQASVTQLFTVDEDGDVQVTGKLDVTGASMSIINGTASSPAITIRNTVVDATGSVTTYDKTRGGVDAVDGDDIHTDIYSGYDDGTPTVDNYVSVLVEINDSAVGAEDGSIAWTVVSGGADVEVLAMAGDAGVEFNSGTVDVDFTIDGDSIADIFKIDAGTDTINMALNAADSQLLITQTDTTGTSTAPLIFINDDRTGTNANTAAEATLVIDPQGTHAISVVDGAVDLGGALAVTGATTTAGAVTLGDAVTDVVTVTGKLAGATPLTFDGATANTVYTILAVADAASTSKTVTLPSITASIALETVATTAITADTTATITVVPGTDTLYTYTVDTDNEDCTLTFSAGGTAGDIATLIFITDTGGSGDEVMTIDGTLSDSAGTLTLANGTAKRYVWVFISDGTIWNEISRTAVLG